MEPTLENVRYFLLQILKLGCDGIYVNNYGTNPDEIKRFENSDWEGKKLKTLKADSCGDWTLRITKVNVKHFVSRDNLDACFLMELPKEHYRTDFYEKITLKKAMKLVYVDVSSNMNYYKGNVDEMEKDLNRTLDRADLYSKSKMKKIEAELFYNQMRKVFGEDGEDDNDESKLVMINDFKIIYFDGNLFLATARRGNYYLEFMYETG